MLVRIPVNKQLAMQVFGTTNAVMIANTKQAWPHFLEWYKVNRQARDPFDKFIEMCIPGEHVYYSHKMYNGQFLPFQQLCNLTFEPLSHLVLHPVYGPWLSLRAVLLLRDGEQIAGTLDGSSDVKTSLSAAQHDALSKLAAEPYSPSNHIRMRQLLGTYCNAAEHAFSQPQLDYHYHRKISI